MSRALALGLLVLAVAPRAAAQGAGELAAPSGTGWGTAPADAPATPAAEPAERAGWADPAAVSPEAPYGGRAYVPRYSLRPLTVTEGVLRIDHGSSGRFGGVAGTGIIMAMHEGLRLGVTSDLEIGVSISQQNQSPVVLDPYLFGTYRFFHDSVVEVGARASVRIPMITTGDTVLRAGVPLVIHGGNFFRLETAVELDFLFQANVSTLLSIPVQVAFSTSDRFSLGVEGWFGLLDGEETMGSVGGFVQATGRTRVRALWDVRWAVSYLIAERALQITSAVCFYPQIW